MNFKFVKDIFGRLEYLAVKHAPELLAGIGVAGFFTTTALAVKATPEAEKLIDEKKAEENKDSLTVTETIQAAWKPYVPAVVTGLSSTICIIGSVSTSLRRNAALATAYEVSREFIDEYRHQVVKAVGEKKEEKIMHAVNEETVSKIPQIERENERRPEGKGEFIFAPTQTRFWSTTKQVEEDLKDLMAQQANSSEEYLGCVDCLAYLGAFDYKTQAEKDMIIDTWTYYGWSLAHQQKYVEFTIDSAVLDKVSGRFVGIINADLQPMDDYWTFEPK